MSTQNIQLFLEKVKNDSELQKELAAVPRSSAQAAAEALSELSGKAGIPVTPAEWEANLPGKTSGTLTDEELSGIAGGGNWFAEYLTELFHPKGEYQEQ